MGVIKELCSLCPKELRGMCCYRNTKAYPTKDKGVFVIEYTNPCQYLNKKGWCKVYTKRHEINPECLTMEESLAKPHALPIGCKYIIKGD